MEDTDSQKGHEEFQSELEKKKYTKYIKLFVFEKPACFSIMKDKTMTG